MPLIWKMVTVVDGVCRRRGLTITLQDLMYVYQVRSAGAERVTFKTKSLSTILIQVLTKDDGSWRSYFFFVKTTSWNAGLSFDDFELNRKSKLLPNFPCF